MNEDPRPTHDDATEVTPSVPAAPAADLLEMPANGGAATIAALPAAEARAARRRWIVAAVATAIVLGVAVLAASLLTGRNSPEALGYVPANAVLVAEIRPELPGDQRARLGDLLAHFPGFKDQSNLDQKIDETVDLLLDRASGGEVDYLSDLKPWLDGPAYIALLGVPSAADATPALLAVLTTDGTVGCADLATGETTTESYDGHELTLAGESGGPVTACTVDGGFGIVGDAESVRAALDTKRDGDGVASTERFRAAQSALAVDRLASLVVDVEAIVEGLRDVDPAMGSALGVLSTEALPDWLAVSLRAEGDALVVTAVAPEGMTPEGAPTPGPARVSDIATRLPATTVAALEAHDVGQGVAAALATARADPEAAAMLEQIEQAAALLGGLDGLTGWIGDLAVVVTLDGAELNGGLVIRATDAVAARAMTDSIRNLLVLVGTGGDITIDEVDHDGTTITIVDLGDLSSLLGDLGGLELPADPAAGTPAILAWAVRDDLVVFGIGEAFVATVLDVREGASLADEERYQTAIAEAGATNNGQGYLDLAAVIAFVGAQLTGSEADSWATDIEPWLAPFDGAAFTSSRSDGLMTSRFVVTVR